MRRTWLGRVTVLALISALVTPGVVAATSGAPPAFTELAALRASDGAFSDSFASAVAVSDDTIVIGAPGHRVGSNVGQGAAYVFRRTGGGWASGTEVARLTASDGLAGDSFGISVAISGDTIVVGSLSPRGTPMAPLPGGAAYVFTKPAGGWTTGTETAKLTASDRAAGDVFGNSVAISVDTIVVGAGGDDISGFDQGSAYVYAKPIGGWSSTIETAKLTASDGAGNDFLGLSVAIDSDVIVVGASGDDLSTGPIGPRDQGSAYVFRRPAAGWATGTETAKLTASDAVASGSFGRAVAVGRGTIVVGAMTAGFPQPDPGSAYVFSEPAGGWATGTETAKLTSSDRAPGDAFGHSLAVSGSSIIVGAFLDDRSAPDQGSAYFFTEPAGGWTSGIEDVKLTTSDGAARWFGRSVAAGAGTIVVGSPTDNLGPDSTGGAAYVFDAVTDTQAPITTIGLTPTDPDGQAGWYVSPVLVGVSAADGPDGSGIAETRCTLDPAADPGAFSELQVGCSFLAGGSAVTADGAHTIYAASVDAAGNPEAPVSSRFKIDLTPPTVGCPSEAPVFRLREPGMVAGLVVDATSGPSASVVTAPADTSSVGARTVTLTGFDLAGNAASVDCPFIVAYVFEGFADPVDNDGLLNAVKAGQAIPLRWRITDANGTAVTDLAHAAIFADSLSCALGVTGDEPIEPAAGMSGLQNFGNGSYQINWLSPRSYADSCKTLRLDLGDGLFRTALFEFRR